MMSRTGTRGALALGVWMATGCGPGSGRDTAGTGLTSVSASGTSSATDTSTSEPGASSSQGATSGSVSGDATTGDGGTDAVTGGSAGVTSDGCACTPGAIEQGEPCDPCGTQQRACADDCSWGAWTCEDAEACALWVLPEGERAWEAVRPEAIGGPEHAPQDPVQAAFDVTLTRVAYVFTEHTYHVLDLEERIWLASGDRFDLFPALGGANLLFAQSINAGEAAHDPAGFVENVTFWSDASYWQFELDASDENVNFVEQGPCCDEQWSAPLAPKSADVRASWSQVVDVYPWVDVPLDACDNAPPGAELDRYGAYLEDDGTVTLQDFGYCFDHVYSAPFEQFPPFSYAGAPSSAALIQAAFYHDGIHVIGPM